MFYFSHGQEFVWKNVDELPEEAKRSCTSFEAVGGFGEAYSVLVG